MQAITALLLVGIGGFAGAIARWGIGTAIKTTLGEPAFPYPTMIVNLLGCFAIGIAYSIWEANNALNLVIIIGFLGGFTTFSTFGPPKPTVHPAVGCLRDFATLPSHRPPSGARTRSRSRARSLSRSLCLLHEVRRSRIRSALAAREAGSPLCKNRVDYSSHVCLP